MRARAVGDAALIRLTARRAHVRRAGDLLGGLLGKGRVFVGATWPAPPELTASRPSWPCLPYERRKWHGNAFRIDFFEERARHDPACISSGLNGSLRIPSPRPLSW